jgi:hypothetical protein
MLIQILNIIANLIEVLMLHTIHYFLAMACRNSGRGSRPRSHSDAMEFESCPAPSVTSPPFPKATQPMYIKALDPEGTLYKVNFKCCLLRTICMLACAILPVLQGFEALTNLFA